MQLPDPEGNTGDPGATKADHRKGERGGAPHTAVQGLELSFLPVKSAVSSPSSPHFGFAKQHFEFVEETDFGKARTFQFLAFQFLELGSC